MSANTRRTTRSTSTNSKRVEEKAGVVRPTVTSKSTSSTAGIKSLTTNHHMKTISTPHPNQICEYHVMKAIDFKVCKPQWDLMQQLDLLKEKLEAHVNTGCRCGVATDRIRMAAGHCLYQSFLVTLNEFNLIMSREEKKNAVDTKKDDTSRDDHSESDGHISHSVSEAKRGSKLDGVVYHEYHNLNFQNGIILKHLDEAVSHWMVAIDMMSPSTRYASDDMFFKTIFSDIHAAFYIYRVYRIITQADKCSTLLLKLADICKDLLDPRSQERPSLNYLRAYCTKLHVALETGDLDSAHAVMDSAEMLRMRYFRPDSSGSTEINYFFLLSVEVNLRSGKLEEGQKLSQFLSSSDIQKNTLNRYFLRTYGMIISSKFPGFHIKHSDHWDEFLDPLNMAEHLTKRWNKDLTDINKSNIDMSRDELSDSIWLRFASYHLMLESYVTSALFYTHMSSVIDVEYYHPIMMRFCRKYCLLFWMRKFLVTGAHIDVMTDNQEYAHSKLITAIELIDGRQPSLKSCQKLFESSRNPQIVIPDETDDEDFKLGRVKSVKTSPTDCMHIRQSNPWEIKKSVMIDVNPELNHPEVYLETKDYLSLKPVECNIFEADVIRLEAVFRLLHLKNPSPEARVMAFKKNNSDATKSERFSFTDCVRSSLNLFKQLKSDQLTKQMRDGIQSYLTLSLRILYSNLLMESLMALGNYTYPLKISRQLLTKSYTDMLDVTKGYESRLLFASFCFLHIKCVYRNIKSDHSIFTFNTAAIDQYYTYERKGSGDSPLQSLSPVLNTVKTNRRKKIPPKVPKGKNPYKNPDFREYFTKCFDPMDGEDELQVVRNEPMSPVVVYKHMLNSGGLKDYFSPDASKSPRITVSCTIKENVSSAANKRQVSKSVSHACSEKKDNQLIQSFKKMFKSPVKKVSVALFDDICHLDSNASYDQMDLIIECLKQLLKYMGNHPAASLYYDVNLLLADAYCNIGSHDVEVMKSSSYHMMETTGIALRYRLSKIIQRREKLKNINRYNLDLLKFNASLDHQEDSDQLMSRVIKSCPDGWRILQINLSYESEAGLSKIPDLIITRMEKGRNTIMFKIKSDKRKHLVDFMAEFKEIIHFSNNSIIDKDPKSFWTVRIGLDQRLQRLLESVEKAWFGPFKGLLLGKLKHAKYYKICQDVTREIISKSGVTCLDFNLLNLLVESLPILSEEEFKTGLVSVFKWSLDDVTGKPSVDYNFLESAYDSCKYIMTHFTSDSFKYYGTEPVALILGKGLEQFPFETMPSLNKIKQEMFRMPSIRFLLGSLESFSGERIYDDGFHERQTYYVVNPTDNLQSTQKTFQLRLESQIGWSGVCGKEPLPQDLSVGLVQNDVYIYFGHGAGSTFYRRIKDNLEGINLNTASLVIGCSSAKLKADGENLEPFGTSLRFITNGAPCYVGVLWDVTDKDIDNYSDRLMNLWIPGWKSKDDYENQENHGDSKRFERMTITQAVSEARDACRLKHLIGAATVVYGLPVSAFMPNGANHLKGTEAPSTPIRVDKDQF